MPYNGVDLIIRKELSMGVQHAKKQDDRTDIRMPVADKGLIKKAADLLGETFSAFVRRSATKEAERILAEHERLLLANRDRDIFCALLDKAPEPTAALRAAMKRHTKQYA